MAGFPKTMPKRISNPPISTRTALGVGRFRPTMMETTPIPMTANLKALLIVNFVARRVLIKSVI